MHVLLSVLFPAVATILMTLSPQECRQAPRSSTAGGAHTPATLLAEAESLLERDPVIIRMRVASADTIPVVDPEGQARDEVRLHPGTPTPPGAHASFHVSLAPEALRVLRRLAVDPARHFVGRHIEVTGRLHVITMALPGSRSYFFYHVLVRDLEQLRVIDDAQLDALDEAVEAFNTRASLDRIGGTQPPLTEDELIAVLRWVSLEETLPTGLTRISDPRPTPEMFSLLRRIVETRQLPANVELESLARFEPDDAHIFEAWSIRLRVSHDDGASFVVRIRDQMLGSREIGDHERAVVDRWRARFAEGIGSMQRAELMEQYRAERDSAIASDQADAR